jgi:peptidoglycan/xylan/chitin deacetylase (PgdA/CDA1 family)
VHYASAMPVGRLALWVATVSALALLVKSLLGAHIPLWFASTALLGYVGLVLTGALVPRLQMFADVFWRGPPGARGVALTFDDGPHPVSTLAILETLARFGAQATFFILTEKAQRHPELVQAIADGGHLLALHGHQHDRWLALRASRRVRAELEQAVAAFVALTGARPLYYRPPVGQLNPRIARVVAGLGLIVSGWSVRGRDGVRCAPDKLVARVVPRLRDGAVVLLHDAAERDDHEPAAVEALPNLLREMAARGLAAVRLDAWRDRASA